jgi:hypothetical protein
VVAGPVAGWNLVVHEQPVSRRHLQACARHILQFDANHLPDLWVVVSDGWFEYGGIEEGEDQGRVDAMLRELMLARGGA